MKLILKFLKPYWKSLIIILFAIIVDVFGGLLIPTITANMINLAVSNAELNLIIQKGFIMLIISIIAGCAALLGSFISAKLSSNMGRDIRNAIYDKSLTFSSSDFDKFSTGSMITRTINDVAVIQQGFLMFMQIVIPVPIICVLGVIFAFRINQNMGFLFLIVMSCVILLSIMIIRKASPIFRKLQYFLDRMNTVLRENITGVRVIRAFNKENYETKRMKKSFSDYAELSIKANYLFASLDSLATVIINLSIVAILYIGGNNIGKGLMQIGDITAITEYFIWVLFYIIMAQMVIILVPRSIACLSRISEVLSLIPKIKDGEKSGFYNISDSSDSSSEVVKLEFVDFRFENADEDVLSKLSFVCKRGETTAIVGGTGSGKSTIAKLILRFYDINSGKILLKNRDIRELTQNILRDSISYVPQKAWLFSGTVADNLRYGNPNASEEEMRHALNIAQVNFIEDLNSPVAQGGTNFSGGQKQRLSIARAVIKKADLYIFDDSFSALDFKTDAALRKELSKEIKDAAILIIAQRISTIIHANQIIVIDEGKIAGIGNHDYLLKNCQVYKNIVESQIKGGTL